MHINLISSNEKFIHLGKNHNKVIFIIVKIDENKPYVITIYNEYQYMKNELIDLLKNILHLHHIFGLENINMYNSTNKVNYNLLNKKGGKFYFPKNYKIKKKNIFLRFFDRIKIISQYLSYKIYSLISKKQYIRTLEVNISLENIPYSIRIFEERDLLNLTANFTNGDNEIYELIIGHK